MSKYQDDPLKNHRLPDFSGGYNSYTQSRSLVSDKEIPVGVNVTLDDNGSVTKRGGTRRYGGEVNSGSPITGMGWLKNNTNNKLILASGTQWFEHNDSSTTALSGMSFTANQETNFVQAVDRLYGANGVNNLAYTTNGTTITEETASGNIGKYIVSYNQRLYMNNTANPDRLYYSNPYSYDPATAGFAISNFGTFDTNLTANPKKNAGFIILMPGAGLEITGLRRDSDGGADYVRVYTKNHGVWQVSFAATNNDGSIAHSIVQIVTTGGSPSGRSIVKVANDEWFYGYDNIYSLGEVASFQNVRVSTKSGRVRSEMDSIAIQGDSKVAAGFFKDTVYFAYQTGLFNDKIIAYDTKLNTWSSPTSQINASCFIEFHETSGQRRFLAGSSNENDSYIYELNSGLNDQSVPISSMFETKATDCNKPGLIKRYAFVDIFYSLIVGALTYEVLLDEEVSLTGVLQFGTSSTSTSGVGSKPIATFPITQEFNPGDAEIQRHNSFRVFLGYDPGKKISLRFSNANLDEQFKIDSAVFYFIEGDVYEN